MSESGAERIQVNPPKRDYPETGRFLQVDGPDEDGVVEVTEWCTNKPFPARGITIKMHTRDWCALFDWWACNIWGMEGDEDGESTTETDQPSPPQAEG